MKYSKQKRTLPHKRSRIKKDISVYLPKRYHAIGRVLFLLKYSYYHNFYSSSITFYNYSAFPIEPKISIFSFTVALIASAPGANNLRGSNPFPSKSLPASIYLRVASAKEI